MTALMIKESVNQTVDNMGFYNSLNACFTLHELNHAHWAWAHENRFPVGLEGELLLPNWRTAPGVTRSQGQSRAGRLGSTLRPPARRCT